MHATWRKLAALHDAITAASFAGAAAVFDLRLVLLAGTVPATFGPPFLEAAAQELDQRSRIPHLRSMPDRARPLVQLGVAALGREAALVGAAGLGRLALHQARGPSRPSAGADAAASTVASR